MEVYNFTGAGGVALSMYNTDEVLFCMLLNNSFLMNIIVRVHCRDLVLYF